VKRRKLKGISKVVDKSNTNAKCIVIAEGERFVFEHFVMVGFEDEGDGPDESLLVTAVSPYNLHKCLTLLLDAYDRAMDDLGPDVRKAIETERAIEDANMDDDDD